MNLDELARYIDHVSTNGATAANDAFELQPSNPPPSRRRRALLVAACLLVVVGVAVGVDSDRDNSSEVVTASGAGLGTSSSITAQESIEPPVTSEFLEGPATVLSTETPYAREIASVLNLSDLELLRRDRTAPDGTPLVSDEVNRDRLDAGYQASIYHGMPAIFFEEHDDAQLPVIDTEVGRAWWSITGGDQVSVALANTSTGIIVRVSYFDPAGQLPELEAVVDKAIELSSNHIVLDETLGR